MNRAGHRTGGFARRSNAPVIPALISPSFFDLDAAFVRWVWVILCGMDLTVGNFNSMAAELARLKTEIRYLKLQLEAQVAVRVHS